MPDGRSATNVPETTAKQLGFIYPYLLNVPCDHLFRVDDMAVYYRILRFALEDPNTMYVFSVFFSVIQELMAYMMQYWEILVYDIEHGTMNDLARPKPEIREEMMRYIKPNPERAAELRAEFEKGFDETLLKRLWPNMSVIYGISGTIYTAYSNEVRKIAAGIPFDFAIHGASEGLFAAPYELESENRLLVVESCYFEFIPKEVEEKILSLDELVPGGEYEIVITNQAGLYRYRIGDIIKCEGYMNGCPIISFARRKGHPVSLCGEKTSEEDLSELVRRLEKRSGCRVDNWVIHINYDNHPASYVLVTENSGGADLSVYSDAAEEDMRQISKLYDRFRFNLAIGHLGILNQKPGTHEEWRLSRIQKGTAPTQVKPVRILDSPEKEEFFMNRIIEQ
ncbi:MAG: GH3 auxin-responsive promoter family protein [Eubacteriaceae bacterium]|nr:GH3 auxin-responsive promoter family protein [Eubacteriaceae bacterium]